MNHATAPEASLIRRRRDFRSARQHNHNRPSRARSDNSRRRNDLTTARGVEVSHDSGNHLRIEPRAIPDDGLANQHILLSRHMAKQYSAVIELNGVAPKLAFTPHLTLYQVPVRLSDMPALYAGLAILTDGTSPFDLNATEFGYNANEESFEVRYEGARPLMRLQADVIGAVNPLRGKLLLERDPAGRSMADRLAEQGTAGDNIRRTGFDAVGDPANGGLFHPHVTINWVRATSIGATERSRLAENRNLQRPIRGARNIRTRSVWYLCAASGSARPRGPKAVARCS